SFSLNIPSFTNGRVAINPTFASNPDESNLVLDPADATAGPFHDRGVFYFVPTIPESEIRTGAFTPKIAQGYFSYSLPSGEVRFAVIRIRVAAGSSMEDGASRFTL